MGSHNGTPLDPLLFWLDNTFKVIFLYLACSCVLMWFQHFNCQTVKFFKIIFLFYFLRNALNLFYHQEEHIHINKYIYLSIYLSIPHRTGQSNTVSLFRRVGGGPRGPTPGPLCQVKILYLRNIIKYMNTGLKKELENNINNLYVIVKKTNSFMQERDDSNQPQFQK